MPTMLDKKKILDFATSFSEIAKREKWVSHYDSDSDSFAIRTPKLSESARKTYINDEFAFYLNDKSRVEGVFIEYFTTNFVAHHKKDFKGIVKELKNQEGENGGVIELTQRETKKLTPELEGIIINSLIPTKALSKS